MWSKSWRQWIFKIICFPCQFSHLFWDLIMVNFVTICREVDIFLNTSVSWLLLLIQKKMVYENFAKILMLISAVTVMEFLSVSGEIQKIFLSQWAYSKDFLISWKTFWVRAIKNWEFLNFGVNFWSQILFNLSENNFSNSISNWENNLY